MATDVTQEIATLVTNAFSLVAALAWSDAIKALLKTNMLEKYPVVGPVAFAVAVSVLAYVVSTTVGKRGKQQCTTLCTPAPATQRPTARAGAWT